jgi:hypothetical protein
MNKRESAMKRAWHKKAALAVSILLASLAFEGLAAAEEEIDPLAVGSKAILHQGDLGTAPGNYSVVGGGRGNASNGECSIVGGGQLNTAFGYGSTISGGRYNEATGFYSAIPGGRKNRAVNYCLAAGYRARAGHRGSFVWGDMTEADLKTDKQDQFLARAKGGFKFFTNAAMTSGARLNSGAGSWANMSDRNIKENFEAIDGRDVLERVAALPIQTWNYMDQNESIRHMGPMAQDLYGAFGLGASDTTITTIDGIGVSLAAIQGLNAAVEEKDAEIEQLRGELAELKARLDRLEK